MKHDPEPDFGTRFAQTWKELQRYLGDLDEAELQSLEGKDLRATLQVLEAQPSLEDGPLLAEAARRSPEALAVALVRERLAALEEDFPEPWGGRFLAHWRHIGGPMSWFTYAKIQEFKGADREQVLALLKPSVMLGTSSLRRQLQKATPEVAAEKVLEQYRLYGLTMAMMLS